MDTQRISISKFPKPRIIIRDAISFSISHELELIAVLSKGNEAAIIPIYPNQTLRGDFLWRSASPCSSLKFSEDSNELAVITRDHEVQIISTRPGRKILDLSSKSLRQANYLDLQTVAKTVELKILDFSKKHLIVTSASGHILSLDWNESGIGAKNYAIATSRSFIDAKLCDEKIFLLSEQGSLDIFDVNSGEEKHSEIKLARYLNEATGSVVERFFVKLAVSSQTLAVTDLNHQIYMIDLPDLMAKVNIESRNATPVQQLADSAEAAGTTPRFKFKGSESFPTKSQHHSFTDRQSLNISLSLHSSSIDETIELPLEYTEITALEGCIVKELSFCPVGLAVWYSKLDDGGLYRIYNTHTGACLDEDFLPGDTKVLMSGYLGLADVLLTPSDIKIHSYNIPMDALASKVIERVGTKGIATVMQGEGWQDLNVAVPILTVGTVSRQIDVIKFSFKLQNLGFGKCMPKLTSMSAGVVKTVENTFQILVRSIEDNVSSLDYAELLVTLSLNHFYDLLSQIYVQISARPEDSEAFGELEQKLMKSITIFRSYLYHPPKFSQLSGDDLNLPKELQGMSLHMQEMWSNWLDMTETEIVKQSIDNNCIPMAHSYFVVAKRMLQKNVSAHFEAVAKDWALELLRQGELSQAQKVFTNLGKIPLEAMKEIYLNSLEEKLQDFLFGYLSNQEMLSGDEIHSGLFLRQVKQTLQKYFSESKTLDKDFLRLTVGFVASQPIIWRDTVWAELALNFKGVDLLMQVEPPAVWNYLLITNRPAVINLWADLCFSESNLNLSSQAVKSLQKFLGLEEDILFAEKLVNMFKIWDVTPEMVESITSADSLKPTKDLVLDHLSRFGIFCAADRTSLSSILVRFVRTRNLMNIKTVLESQSAVVTWKSFCTMLLKHCTQQKLAPVMFSFLADNEDLEELVNNCDVSKELKQWLQGWFSLVKLSDDPSADNILEAIEANLHILADGNVETYLADQPFIVLAIIWLGSKGKFVEILSGQSDELKAPLTKDLVESVRRSFPVLDIILTEEAWKESQKPDISLYKLLERGSAFDISKLFGWRELHKSDVDDVPLKMPSFSKGSPCEKYAFNQHISYEYYLKQGRPSYAYCSFIVDEFKQFRKLSKKRIKQSCNVAHGIALNYYSHLSVVAACISFIEMLGVKSEKARLHVTVGTMILKNIPVSTSKEEIGEYLNCLLTNKEEAALKLHILLEQSLVPNDLNQISTFVPIQNWAVAVRFAKVHNLPMPESLLKFYCKSDMWLHFVLCLEIYQYSTEQAFHLLEHMESKTIRDHLKHSFIRTTRDPIKRQTSPLKTRDTRKSLYSKIGLREQIVKSSPTESSSPDGASLLAISWSSESSLPSDMISSTFVSPTTENDLFRCILACHSSLDPPRAMLEACLSHNNPFLAVLSSCYENSSSTNCLGTWIVTSLSKSAREILDNEFGGCLHIWNENNICNLWLIALRTNHIATVAMSLDVFLPECPLRTLARFIKNSAVDKNFDEAVDLIQTFKSQCQNLPVAVTDDNASAFLMQRTWIYKTAVQIVCTTLAHNFTSSFHQSKFLHVLCKSAFSEYITAEAPDFTHLLQLQECLLETGVQLDYSALCVSRRGSEKELQACLQRLVDGGFFNQALELARIAGLPRDTVVIAQWNKAMGEHDVVGSGDVAFWKECQAAFVESKIQPVVAAEFFQNHAETRTNLTERYQVLQLAYSWFCLSKQLSARKRQDCYITKAIEVELEMWRTRLKIGKNCDVDAPLAPKLFIQTRKELFAEAGIGYIDSESKLEDENEIKALDEVIGELLDQGRVASALRLEALFCHQNKDLRLLVTCLSLAESEIMPYQLSSEQRMLMEQTYTPSSSFRRRPLYSLKISSLASLSLSHGAGSSLGSEFIEVPPKEKQEALTAIEKLSDRLLYGKVIGERVAACFRVSMNMDKSYVDIVTVEDPLSLLKTAISQDCLNKFAVASDLSLGGQISKEDMSLYLSGEIFAVVLKNQVQGGIFWGYDLDSNFHLVLELCQDPILLGKHLLDLTRPKSDSSASPEKTKKGHGMIVELLIRSHDCYTSACDMEGIAEVLLRARSLTASLLQQQEWQLMVRLVTGIGRYNEMIYIFKILKDHEQFEYLLGKGMDKIPGLKIALLDFVRSKCAENRELLQLVALHFRLYSEAAEIWELEARATISRLLSVTVLELGIAISATKYKPKPKQPTPLVLKASADLGHHLKIAMQNFSHAAEYYLQANKLTKAMQSASQAELVALQISLTIGIPNGQTLDCLFEQEQAQVSNLITNHLSFAQAVIVAKAYNHPVDWGAALYQHCVMKKEQKYLTDFMQSMTLTPVLVEDISRRFQHESSINSDMAKMMKIIVNSVKSVEVKYRVASQLGFKDILENMISGTDLPYLKDTVWRRGTKNY